VLSLFIDALLANCQLAGRLQAVLPRDPDQAASSQGKHAAGARLLEKKPRRSGFGVAI